MPEDKPLKIASPVGAIFRLRKQNELYTNKRLKMRNDRFPIDKFQKITW
jgi:hypothetical protein